MLDISGNELVDVISEMRAFYAKSPSWNQLGEVLGISGSYARLIVNGDRRIPQDVHDRWIAHTRGKALRAGKLARVCPSCFEHGIEIVHGEGLDCKNRPVAAVVTLAPGETVTRNGHAASKPRKADPPCFRPRLALDKQVRRGQLLKLLEECE